MKFKKGDLVTLKKCCKDSGRFAIIVEEGLFIGDNCCTIIYLDSGCEVRALYSNLEMISESW